MLFTAHAMKKTHFDHLADTIPDIPKRRILDLGCGRGEFLVDAASRGVTVVGLEYNPLYIEEALALAKEKQVAITVQQGAAEHMPFEDGSFDFINMAEVIEHVADPLLTLREVYRVLAPGGLCYMSVPNRYGLKDPHFHLYGVNWLPRSVSDLYLSLFDKHKEYTQAAGHQRLRDMHYYRYDRIVEICRSVGFGAMDIREQKVVKRFQASSIRSVIPLAYHMLRSWYFDTFHLLLTKT